MPDPRRPPIRGCRRTFTDSAPGGTPCSMSVAVFKHCAVFQSALSGHVPGTAKPVRLHFARDRFQSEEPEDDEHEEEAGPQEECACFAAAGRVVRGAFG